MKIKFGIILKLFIWYLATSLIFYGTILIVFIHIRQLVKTSEEITSNNYRVANASKKMIDSLFWMAENQKKYDLLKKEEYKEYFASAQKEYEANLFEILWFGGGETGATWDELYREYQGQFSPQPRESPDPDIPWLKEEVINQWVDKISRARFANEQQIQTRMNSLNERGHKAVQWGVIGLVSSLLVGLLGIIAIAFSMNRPLRELRRGIKSLSRTGLTDPIRIYSHDEFGELAGAFNDM
ncbi:MAG: HAMP domain-containing protein, partial [Syntrophobacteraceae bacterium]